MNKCANERLTVYGCMYDLVCNERQEKRERRQLRRMGQSTNWRGGTSDGKMFYFFSCWIISHGFIFLEDSAWCVYLVEQGLFFAYAIEVASLPIPNKKEKGLQKTGNVL